jgi:hypothetical protein
LMPKTSNMPKMNRFVALEESLEAARAAHLRLSPLGLLMGTSLSQTSYHRQKRVRFAGASNLLRVLSSQSGEDLTDKIL